MHQIQHFYKYIIICFIIQIVLSNPYVLLSHSFDSEKCNNEVEKQIEKIFDFLNLLKANYENTNFSSDLQTKISHIRSINNFINDIKHLQIYKTNQDNANEVKAFIQNMEVLKSKIIHGDSNEVITSITKITDEASNLYANISRNEQSSGITRAPTTPDYYYYDLKECKGCNGLGKLKNIFGGMEKCSICNGLGQVYVRKDAPPCGRCSGTGRINLGKVTLEWCKGCGGTGWVKVPGVTKPPAGSAITFPPPVEAFKEARKCALCGGTGISKGDNCKICEGDGYVIVNKNSVSCKFCSGRGTMPTSSSQLCIACQGTGYIERPLPDYWSIPQSSYTVNAKYSYPHELLEEKFCNYCNGKGSKPFRLSELCPICKGAGSILIRKDCPKCAFCKGQGKLYGKITAYDPCPGCNGYSYILLPVPAKPYLAQMPPIEILITYKNCAYCSGSGCEPNQKDWSGLPKPCPACNGKGVIVLHKDSPPCRFCGGTGLQNAKRCVNCGGTGWLPLPIPK